MDIGERKGQGYLRRCPRYMVEGFRYYRKGSGYKSKGLNTLTWAQVLNT